MLYCKAHGMEAYQGGTCNETEVSAQCCVHLAMAARPNVMLAKPGMGFDEGFTIVKNEQERIRAVLKSGDREETDHGGTETKKKGEPQVVGTKRGIATMRPRLLAVTALPLSD